jgi:hypothetical protein
MFNYVPIRAGSTLSPTERRLTCAKCGEKLFFPTTVHDTQAGYCGECRWLLRLRTAVPYDVEHRGYPKRGDFRRRLAEEPEYFYVRPVNKWYNPNPEPSDMWRQKMKEAEVFNKQLQNARPRIS